MQKYLTTRAGQKIWLNTAVDDEAINAGIEADPDTLEVTEEMAAQMRPFLRAGRGWHTPLEPREAPAIPKPYDHD